MAPTPTPTATASSDWTTVLADNFDGTALGPAWITYNGPYGSGVGNCAAPSQDVVSGGFLHLVLSHLSSGNCGSAWYTGGVSLHSAYSGIDQRVTVRFRLVPNGLSFHYIIPMRWPDDGAWPSGGEEDYCEGDAGSSGCDTFLHCCTSSSQVSHSYTEDLTQWHTIQTTRLNHVVTVAFDGVVVWTYNGSSSTLPDTVKHVVLQQECLASGCPSGTTGSAEIQVDSITVENPS